MNRQLLRRVLGYSIGPLLAALLLWLVLRRVNLYEVLRQLQGVSFRLWLVSSSLILSQVLFRAWRWRILLNPITDHIPFRSLTHAIILGNATNILVPGRLGELLRPIFLASKEGLPIAACIGTILADRWLDLIAVVVLLVGGLLTATLSGQGSMDISTVLEGAAAVLLVVGTPMLLALLISSRRERLESWLSRQNKIMKWPGEVILSFSRGTEAVKAPRVWAILICQSLLIWLAIGLGKWVGLRACGVELSVGQTFVLLPILMLGVSIPTPGGLGGYQAGMTVGLVHFFGVDQAAAVTASFVVHLAAILPILLITGLLLATRTVTGEDLAKGFRQARRVRKAEG